MLTARDGRRRQPAAAGRTDRGAGAHARGGRSTKRSFEASEDAAVDEALALQEEAGLDVVTDGEMRRLSFQSQLTAAVEGFADWDLDAFLWGEWHSEELGDLTSSARPSR